MTTAALTTPAAATPLRQDALVMGLVGLAHATSHFGHMLLPSMFPLLMRDFGLSFSQMGALMTVVFVVSGVGQALAGFLVDKVGARPVLYAALATFCAACGVLSMAQGYAWLLAGAVLLGLANASFHPVDFTILNQRVSSPRLGHAFSVHGVTGNLGWAIAPPFFALMLWLSDWRGAYLGAAALYAAVLAVVLWNRAQLATQMVPRKAALPVGDVGGAAGAQMGVPGSMAFLKLPELWWCFLFFLLFTVTLAVVQSFAVPLLQAMHGVSFAAATATLTAYMLCGAAGMLLGGFVAARYARHSDRVVASCMTAGAVCMALAATGWLGATGSMVVLAATGLAIGIGGPSRDMMIKKAAPAGATGRVYGMVYSGLDVGFAISPVLFGMLMDRNMYVATLLGAALVLLASVGAALAVGQRISAKF
jgi:MFS transporter, FSR family, fosmidomycin resistance protein